jgi:transcriptional regulator with XRE-family HTH domain
MTTTARDTHRYLRAFGRNVKVQRVGLDLTQEQLAERAGLCRTFIGKLERGQTGINLVELPALAQALGMRQAELLPELDRPGPAARHER